jgi:hypothetical protein
LADINIVTLQRKWLQHSERFLQTRFPELFSSINLNVRAVHGAGLSDFSVRGAARRHLYRQIYAVFIVQVYQTSQYVMPRGGIFLGRRRSTFAGNSDDKMNVQSAYTLNILYNIPGMSDKKGMEQF